MESLSCCPQALQAITDIALTSRKEDLDKFRRPFRLQSTEAPNNPVVGGIDELKRAEIQWQDRLATQAKVVASDDTRSTAAGRE